MLSSLSLRPDSDPSIYGYRYLLKKVERIIEAMTLSMLRSQRQYIPDLNLLFRCLAAINTDLLCILLLSTNCSLNVTKSCIIHPHSKTTFLKVSKLKELQFEILEFFHYLRTWSTQKVSQWLLVVFVLLLTFPFLIAKYQLGCFYFRFYSLCRSFCRGKNVRHTQR